jgi:hypothetical protein
MTVREGVPTPPELRNMAARGGVPTPSELRNGGTATYRPWQRNATHRGARVNCIHDFFLCTRIMTVGPDRSVDSEFDSESTASFGS